MDDAEIQILNCSIADFLGIKIGSPLEAAPPQKISASEMRRWIREQNEMKVRRITCAYFMGWRSR